MQEIDETYYPPKPEIADSDTASIIKTILSLAAFVGLFFLLDIPVNLIFLISLVLFLHEMGHLIAMKTFGYQDVGMLFIPFLGAVVSGRKDEMSQLQKIIITIAGPLPGILIGIIMIISTQTIDTTPSLISMYGVIFIAVNVVNLLPISPLDGGRLFESLFFSFNEVTKLIFSAISALVIVVVGAFYQNYPILIIGFFLLTKLHNSYKLLKVKKKLKALKVNLISTYHNLSDRDYYLIRKEYILSAKLQKIMESDSESYDEREDVLAPAIRNLLTIPVKRDITSSVKFTFIALWVGAIYASYYFAYPLVAPIIDAIQNN